MQTNHVPPLGKDNPTGCCPRFNPKDWDNQIFVLKNKPFVRFTVRSFLYMPLNMGSMVTKVTSAIEKVGALDKTEHVILSNDLSPWQSEHYLAVTKKVEGLDNVTLSGKYLAKVFEGPFQDAPKWIAAMKAKTVYLYYTTCPKCAKYYGRNYVVALAKI